MFKIKKLRSQNFRNLNDSLIEFSPSINCLFGENGQGKTNILEAIYYIFKRKSFRKNVSYPQLLSFECEKPQIILQTSYQSKNINESLSLKVENSNIVYSISGKLSKRPPSLPILFISPFESSQFFLTTKKRRDVIDDFISTIDVNFKKNISRYDKANRNKNKLLSTGGTDREIDAIDTILIPLIDLITKRRIEFICEIKEQLKKIFFEIFSEEHELEIELHSSFINATQQKIKEIINKSRAKERIIGHTVEGVHRDDFIIYFDSLNSFDYCSLGQQKMSYFSLIFAYIKLFRYKLDAYPVLLLDDVSGELDALRWRRLTRYIQQKDFQIFITTANEAFRKELESIENAGKFLVKQGIVKKL